MVDKREVGKREAATVQIDTAIKLYLENRDLISAYTLSAAANGILEGVYENERDAILARQRAGLPDQGDFRFSWKEEWEIRIKPEHRKEGFRLLNAAQNFFKHANNDHDGVLEFADVEQTGHHIFFTVGNFRLVYRDVTRAMNVFFSWFLILHPNLIGEGNPLKQYIVDNPNCERLNERFSQAELAAIGYENLESACPELFPPTDIESHLQPPSSDLSVRVPTAGDKR